MAVDDIQDLPPVPFCATCGQCCKRMPGQFFPADLGPDQASREAKARDLLATGDYSIDWWEGDPDIYFLRPATVAARGEIFDPSWGGRCVLLGEDGCTLAREDRPTVCKALKPSATGSCDGIGKSEVANAWESDTGWLYRLGIEMAAKDESDV